MKVPVKTWWKDDMDHEMDYSLKNVKAKFSKPQASFVEWDIARFLSTRGCKFCRI
jgi:hypothetical protein